MDDFGRDSRAGASKKLDFERERGSEGLLEGNSIMIGWSGRETLDREIQARGSVTGVAEPGVRMMGENGQWFFS